jgi:hypothetical protein
MRRSYAVPKPGPWLLQLSSELHLPHVVHEALWRAAAAEVHAGTDQQLLNTAQSPLGNGMERIVLTNSWLKLVSWNVTLARGKNYCAWTHTSTSTCCEMWTLMCGSTHDSSLLWPAAHGKLRAHAQQHVRQFSAVKLGWKYARGCLFHACCLSCAQHNSL